MWGMNPKRRRPVASAPSGRVVVTALTPRYSRHYEIVDRTHAYNA